MAVEPQATGGVRAVLTLLMEQPEAGAAQVEMIPVPPLKSVPPEATASGAVMPWAMPPPPEMVVPQAAMAAATAARQGSAAQAQ